MVDRCTNILRLFQSIKILKKARKKRLNAATPFSIFPFGGFPSSEEASHGAQGSVRTDFPPHNRSNLYSSSDSSIRLSKILTSYTWWCGSAACRETNPFLGAVSFSPEALDHQQPHSITLAQRGNSTETTRGALLRRSPGPQF